MDEATRNAEFGHLQGVTYLDHAGATLYSKSQLEAHVTSLTANLYGNPHSHNPSSQLCTAAVDHARDSILRFFGTDSRHYDVVFTSGCTSALKLLSESFPWCSPASSQTPNTGVNPSSQVPSGTRVNGSVSNHLQEEGVNGAHLLEDGTSLVEEQDRAVRTSAVLEKESANDFEREDVTVHYTRDLKDAQAAGGELVLHGSVFCYLEDNHTSVVGMREVAAQFGASIVCTTEQDIIRSSHLKHRVPECVSEASQSVQVTLHDKDCEEDQQLHSELSQREVFHLFAYPAQSNFSGRKYPLSWATDIPNGHLSFAGVRLPPTGPECPSNTWKVCLDAASFVGTSPLDLSEYPVDFVTLSFYKMFGFPTGLGALLVRIDNCRLLHKRYFGGGTVVSTISRTGFRVSRSDLHERLEDGTVPFLEILALEHGFQTLSRLAGPMSLVAEHTFTLARYVHNELSAMTHFNGTPVSVLYCDGDFTDPATQGGIVNFNLLRPNGKFVGYSEVANLACVHDIHLRTGCFCNTGACMGHLHIDTAHIHKHLEAGHVCGDTIDLVDGKPTGSVRISFGYMSTFEDAKKFVMFIEQNFRSCSENAPSAFEGGGIGDVMVSSNDTIGQNSGDVIVNVRDVMKEGGKREVEEATEEGGEGEGESGREGETRKRVLRVGDQVVATSSDNPGSVWTCVLDTLLVYPIKSCGAMQVSEWPIGECGLQYDREWAILSEHRACLSQKQEPRLSLIRPYVHSHSRELELRYEGCASVRVPIREVDTGEKEGVRGRGGREGGSVTVDMCHMRVCGDRVSGVDCGDSAAAWLTNTLRRGCTLVRQSQQRRGKQQPTTTGSGGEVPLLSLANEAQYLLVSVASVKQLLSEIAKKQPKQLMTVEDLVLRFRPNLVVSGNGMAPYAEDEWSDVVIGDQRFVVTGRCSRCRTVCVDQTTGAKTSEPLQTLTQLRGSRATFGVYLSTRT